MNQARRRGIGPWSRVGASRLLLGLLVCLVCVTDARAVPPARPDSLVADDRPFDGGDALNVTVAFSGESERVVVEKSFEQHGVYAMAEELNVATSSLKDVPSMASLVPYLSHLLELTISDLPTDKPVWFRAYVVSAGGEKSPYTYAAQPGIATQQFFDGNRFWFFIVLTFVCGSVVVMILVARSGAPMWIRKISALDAIDEAVGRATEMGKSCLFVTGVQDLNEIETIAGITVLARVAEKAAEYDATVIVPTSRSLVMTAARETSQAAYLAAGRPDAYQEDRIYYVTDDQFGFVAHLSGYMQREKPAACFYMGQFYAESLLLGETGNTIGAIQIAGTAQPAQLPFFVAACDYTLIGEEFFAASAYLSRDPDQLGSLKGQDIGKLLVMAILFVGVTLVTVVNVTAEGTTLHDLAKTCADYLQNHILQSS